MGLARTRSGKNVPTKPLARTRYTKLAWTRKNKNYISSHALRGRAIVNLPVHAKSSVLIQKCYLCEVNARKLWYIGARTRIVMNDLKIAPQERRSLLIIPQVSILFIPTQ